MLKWGIKMDDEIGYENYGADTLDSWVIEKVDDWNDTWKTNYKNAFDEYYRLWRGKWSEEDKANQSERSTIISPALQQAVESSVAEIEEATFGRGAFFNIRDDITLPEEPKTEEEAQATAAKMEELKQNKLKIRFLREKLNDDFAKAGIRKAVGECLINSAVYGTGIAEIVVDMMDEVKPVQTMYNNQVTQGTTLESRTIVKLRPIQPQNFKIDPLATSIETSLGVAIDEFVQPHQIKLLQEQGVYLPVDIGVDSKTTSDLDADHTIIDQPKEKVRLTKYFGLVPRHLLDKFNGTDEIITDLEEEIEASVEEQIEDAEAVLSAEVEAKVGPFYVEAMVVIANGSTILKAQENPFYLKDRPIVAFQWDVVPGRFWGRGVCEKGYSSQKALDTELRARIDALALTNAPMIAMDSTRMPRGAKPQVRPGKVLLTNGDPREVLQPFNFGSVSQISFAQAEALQRMVQTSTGAIDAAGIPGSINGEATAAGISMSLSAIIKRHKRTLVNFQDSFLIPMVKMAACRYMQFEPDRYPVNDYVFEVTSTLGIIAREYEVTQLVQLLQTMSPDTPMYPMLVSSIVDNMQLANREELMRLIEESAQPNPEEAKRQQAMDQMQIDFQQSQTNLLNSQAATEQARGEKVMAEIRALPLELENDRVRALAALERAEKEPGKDFKEKLGLAESFIKEGKLGLDKAKFLSEQ
ncbi:MAG: hypothetical protein CMO36_04580 [Verrucomicrobiaceae bacterium]|nr:hypothetical protein [Verrucomicrobiaceae bacterium]